MGAPLLLLPNPDWLYARAKRLGSISEWHVEFYVPFSERSDQKISRLRLRRMKEHLTAGLGLTVFSQLGDFRHQLSSQEQLVHQVEVRKNRCFHMIVYGHVISDKRSVEDVAKCYGLMPETVRAYMNDMDEQTIPQVVPTRPSPPPVIKPQQVFLPPPTPILPAEPKKLPIKQPSPPSTPPPSAMPIDQPGKYLCPWKIICHVGFARFH